ncbi:hypothetical protein ACM64Y_20350 [Novispirillum sp. DQ9]|uniref:hypothetical protein n=1 Tax=Novispirillum sp. DQ9 TaxID=3398612 RepID=UPI003C7CB781
MSRFSAVLLLLAQLTTAPSAHALAVAVHRGLYLADDPALLRGDAAAVDDHAVPALEAARPIGNGQLIASLLNRRIRSAVARGAGGDAGTLLADLEEVGDRDAGPLRAAVKGGGG